MEFRKMCSGLLAALFLTGLICCQSVAASAKDGKYYFGQMEQSMLEVLAENQKLINTNADGSMKSRKLQPDDFFKQTNKQFKKIGVGRTFRMKNFEGETSPEEIAPVLTTLLQAGRITTAKAQQDINTESDGSVKLKKFIPAVFGRLTLERFTEKTGVHMKQTTLGKGQFKERNPYNAPNDWEKKALEQFESDGWKLNQGVGVSEGGEYRYVKPVYIKKGCLKCHGVPVGDKGPYGHTKEGYEVNDVRGGISIAMPI